jgi:hypothetical protein
VEARRWINATLVNMVDWDDPQRTLKPLIDGGTEGGNTKVLSSLPLVRIQRPGPRNYSNSELMLRVFLRYAGQANGISSVHHCNYPETSRTLCRMGVGVRMAPSVSR